VAQRLKLPGKVIFGLFLFCAALLILSHFGIVPLDLLPYGWIVVLVAALLFLCLSATAAGGEAYEAWKRHRAHTNLPSSPLRRC
jgi:hypothetical protein